MIGYDTILQRQNLKALATASHAVDENAALRGLAAFAPFWAFASIFSLAGERDALQFHSGATLFLITWAGVIASAILILRPRHVSLLWLLAAIMVARYLLIMPVGSNNKFIAFFMNAAIVVIIAHAYFTISRPSASEAAYFRMRPVARALLAVMYFYGIFHKINTDFLDPSVSCASALYSPLASTVGLGESLYGKYFAIAATFIIEAITIIGLYWRRYFAIGLIIGLVFHYVIPLSAYSWYMDFSSLVLALYALSVPPEVITKAYANTWHFFHQLKERISLFWVGLTGLVIVTGLVVVFMQSGAPLGRLYHSFWLLLWAVYGAATMMALSAAALDHLPYRGQAAGAQPIWVYAFPLMLFISCLSPYVGLKTESSINMFSNLHTEGGITNHLFFKKPPYLFDYQTDVVRLIDSSEPVLRDLARNNQYLVLYVVKEYLRQNPNAWITYEKDSVLHEKVRATAFSSSEQATFLERNFLVFKAVDFARPKVCTH